MARGTVAKRAENTVRNERPGQKANQRQEFGARMKESVESLGKVGKPS